MLPPGVHSLAATSRFVDDSGQQTAGHTFEEACAHGEQARQRMKEVMSLIGTVYANAKEEPIDSVWAFLGLELDSLLGEMRISEERLASGLRQLREIASKAYVPRKELERIVGVLNFAVGF